MVCPCITITAILPHLINLINLIIRVEYHKRMTAAEGSPATTAKERLTQFLKDGKDWERKATNIPGIFLFKLPGLRGRGSPLVAIEINPVDSSGSATKKRGIVIRSSSELEEISRLLTNPKISQLAKSIDEVNPDVKTSAKGGSSEIFEI
jgi:hypothetical protein